MTSSILYDSFSPRINTSKSVHSEEDVINAENVRSYHLSLG